MKTSDLPHSRFDKSLVHLLGSSSNNTQLSHTWWSQLMSLCVVSSVGCAHVFLLLLNHSLLPACLPALQVNTEPKVQLLRIKWGNTEWNRTLLKITVSGDAARLAASPGDESIGDVRVWFDWIQTSEEMNTWWMKSSNFFGYTYIYTTYNKATFCSKVYYYTVLGKFVVVCF